MLVLLLQSRDRTLILIYHHFTLPFTAGIMMRSALCFFQDHNVRYYFKKPVVFVCFFGKPHQLHIE